jgi:hypothetical protein
MTPGDGTAPVELSRGRSVFVAAATGRYRLKGTGTIFRATTGLA